MTTPRVLLSTGGWEETRAVIGILVLGVLFLLVAGRMHQNDVRHEPPDGGAS